MKITAISILIAVSIIGGAIVFGGGRQDSNGVTPEVASNVSVIADRQIIKINAKGGYAPRVTKAKADIPTVIEVNTQGTFDCSSALTIPDLGYRSNLPPSGQTLIYAPQQKSGSMIEGFCAMGMYNFQIQFD